MPSSNVEVIEIGIPGPPGAGVSAAEKASFVTLSGANVFTNTNRVRSNSATAFIVESASATTDRSLVVDATGKEIELWNGADLRGLSDAGSTETWSIDSATGNIQTDGILTVDGGQIKGEQFWLTLEFDGGGSALTTGVKRRIKLPYNFDVVSDGTAAWEVALDQSGSIGFDLWVDTYANYPPTNADRVSGTIGSQNPRVSSAIKAQSATLTGWTTSFVKGRYLFVAIDSITTATWATLSLHIKKT